MAESAKKFQPDHAVPGFQGGDRQDRNTGVMLRAWRGMMSNGSPHVLGTDYLQVSENMQSVVLGQIFVRSGFREVTFDV